MKKLILIVAVSLSLFLLGYTPVNANNCTTDSECYNVYLNYNSQGESYVNYYYNWKTYKIYVPETRQEFIKLEFDYLYWKLNREHKYFNTIRLNIALIKHWLEPLYY